MNRFDTPIAIVLAALVVAAALAFALRWEFAVAVVAGESPTSTA
jgi:hypothetical protein